MCDLHFWDGHGWTVIWFPRYKFIPPSSDFIHQIPHGFDAEARGHASEEADAELEDVEDVELEDLPMGPEEAWDGLGWLGMIYPLVMSNIAIENGHLLVDFPIKNGDFP